VGKKALAMGIIKTPGYIEVLRFANQAKYTREALTMKDKD
jgi:hypothetical protein